MSYYSEMIRDSGPTIDIGSSILFMQYWAKVILLLIGGSGRGPLRKKGITDTLFWTCSLDPGSLSQTIQRKRVKIEQQETNKISFMTAIRET